MWGQLLLNKMGKVGSPIGSLVEKDRQCRVVYKWTNMGRCGKNFVEIDGHGKITHLLKKQQSRSSVFLCLFPCKKLNIFIKYYILN